MWHLVRSCTCTHSHFPLQSYDWNAMATKNRVRPIQVIESSNERTEIDEIPPSDNTAAGRL